MEKRLFKLNIFNVDLSDLVISGQSKPMCNEKVMSQW